MATTSADWSETDGPSEFYLCEMKINLDVGKNKMSPGSSTFDHFKLTSSSSLLEL